MLLVGSADGLNGYRLDVDHDELGRLERREADGGFDDAEADARVSPSPASSCAIGPLVMLASITSLLGPRLLIGYFSSSLSQGCRAG